MATLLLLVVNVAANAYDFKVDGIYYNILSPSSKTCAVTYLSYNSSSNSTAYIGDMTIPENVTYNGTTYSVTSIGSYAFGGCSEMTAIYSLNPEPPTCSSYVFYNVRTSTCKLYVPNGSEDAYSTASQWKDFKIIVEKDMTPVNSITADGNAEAVGYYTTDGKQIPSLQRGINIVRYSDGSAKKVLVK